MANIEIIEFLLEQGLEVDGLQESDDSIPLFAAVSSENFEAIRILIDADVNIQESKLGDTVLNRAIGVDNIELVSFLLDTGANPNLERFNGEGASIFAAIGNNNVSILKLLLHHNAKTNTFHNFLYSPLTYCVVHNRIECAKIILEHKDFSENKNCEGNDAFDYAVFMGSDAMIKTLIKGGFSPNKSNNRGIPLFILTCDRNDLDIIKALTQSGVDL